MTWLVFSSAYLLWSSKVWKAVTDKLQGKDISTTTMGQQTLTSGSSTANVSGDSESQERIDLMDDSAFDYKRSVTI